MPGTLSMTEVKDPESRRAHSTSQEVCDTCRCPMEIALDGCSQYLAEDFQGFCTAFNIIIFQELLIHSGRMAGVRG